MSNAEYNEAKKYITDERGNKLLSQHALKTLVLVLATCGAVWGGEAADTAPKGKDAPTVAQIAGNRAAPASQVRQSYLKALADWRNRVGKSLAERTVLNFELQNARNSLAQELGKPTRIVKPYAGEQGMDY